MLNNVLKIVVGFSLLVNSLWAEVIKPVVINKETPSYLIDVKYPQGFADNKINSALKHYIDETQKSFLAELSEDEDTPADAPGKTGLNVTYSVLYNAKTALSVRFDVSIYHKGAAHPLNTVVVQNFLHGEKINLADLFQPQADYLTTLARFCKKMITAKKISDPKWIAEGTKATTDNYSVWYFTEKGIGILFNTYQVAAYVYGPQTVDIPLAVIASTVKPELIKTLWSN
ncbi:DUF3298 and DUF4163 domain-containing protein [Legionella sp. km772]|uniref:DUF3298 and DUF4163 domain-containing protein n=1 Tax=Legionella sp. km772 TaxID=2498111 RepID=UPI000F8E7010|nr:DUF3298 and DUF4163 domain-containing protein [Legionella sp. km772]RUR11164.1 DUF3298/DUF4163 domain-containing protein [Legionella sp. km772]